MYEAADNASKMAQKQFLHALSLNLGCLVVASALSVINYAAAWFAIVQTVFLLVSLNLAIYFASKQPQRVWYSTRALAESIKTVAWRYMMRAEPYNIGDADAKQHFLRGVRKILDTNKQVCAHAIEMLNQNQITERMLENRALTLVDRKNLYITQRINDQLNWYIKNEKVNRVYSHRWFLSLILVNVIAVILALVRIVYPDQPFWPTNIFVTAAGVIMAWLQTKRFQELAASYALTVHEISLLRDSMPDDDNEQSFSVFVADSESAFSREHTQWQARRDAD